MKADSRALWNRVIQPSGRELLHGGWRAAEHLLRMEIQAFTFTNTVLQSLRERQLIFSRDWSFAELLAWAAEHYGDAIFIEFEQENFSFKVMNARAHRVACELQREGMGPGRGIAIMMGNHPRFLDVFFASQQIGAWVVPVNTALVDDGLAYVLNHSEVSAVVCDTSSAEKIARLLPQLPHLSRIWVSRETGEDLSGDHAIFRDYAELEPARAGTTWKEPSCIDPRSPGLLMYTSGTTGRPKAVVSDYGQQRVRHLGLLANLLYERSDKLYTCLPLFHANALMLTVMSALWIGIPVHLSRRFSASRFWQEVADCGATQFNTVGSMIPVLLKTPPGSFDCGHQVKRVLSAACPKEAWKIFEQRFGVRLWEAYGAVDGGGMAIFNAGNAPMGSIGRLPRHKRWKLVDQSGCTVPRGQPGELWVYVGTRQGRRVSYWKNDKASQEKVTDGWLKTGDLMQADTQGYLYFVGRNTDSMRVRGENVSAYEVEKVVDAHPDILESAAFGVPSPLGEQDIMLAVVQAPGHTLNQEEFAAYLRQRLPRFAVPSWLDILQELPKTGTHRVIKGVLKERGVSAGTLRLNDAVSTNQVARMECER